MTQTVSNIRGESASRNRLISESAWRSAWTKFPFLAFCWTSLLIVGAIEALLYYLIYPRISSISPIAGTIIGLGMLLFFAILAAGLFLITATALTGFDLLYPHTRRKLQRL